MKSKYLFSILILLIVLVTTIFGKPIESTDNIIVTGILLKKDGSPAVEKLVVINEWDGNDIVIRTTGKSEIEGFIKISTLSARTDSNGLFTVELQRSIYGDQKEFAVAIQTRPPIFLKEGMNLKWAVDATKKPVIFKIDKTTKKVDLGKITYDPS